MSTLTTRVQKLEDDVRPRLRAVEEQAQAVSREVLRLGGLVERLGARELPEILDKVAAIEEARLQMAETNAKAVHAAKTADEQVSRVQELQRSVDLLKRGVLAPGRDARAADGSGVQSKVDELEQKIMALYDAGGVAAGGSYTGPTDKKPSTKTLALPETTPGARRTSVQRLSNRSSKEIRIPKDRNKPKQMGPPIAPEPSESRCWVKKRDKGTILADFLGIFLSRYVVLDGVYMRWFSAANQANAVENAMGFYDFSDLSQGSYQVYVAEDGMVTLRTPGGFFDCDLKENPLNPGEAFVTFSVAVQKAITFGVETYQYNTYQRGVECGAIVPGD
jgi:hypothetical protein